MIDSLTPTCGRVLVEPLLQEAFTASGLAIPDEARDATERALVLRVAEDVYEVVPGEVVILGAYRGQEHEIDGKKVHFVPIDEILGVVEDDDAA